MKKFLLSFSLFAMTLMASAQEPTLKARSIYDVNQDDKVSISDVPALSNRLLGKAADKTAVDTQSLLDVLNALKAQYVKILTELTDLKAKVSSITSSGEGGADKGNTLAGIFSVSSTKKVQFTKGNLYCDGSVFHFEANQTDYPTSWNASHVGHFYWANSTDYLSAYTNYMPYALKYSNSSVSTSDKFFCGGENPLTVDGTSGCFALSESEWNYLINTRTNASNLCKCCVTVGDKKNCLIIAPDGFSGTLKASYTLDELSSLDLVCLPAAGYRNGSYFYFAEGWGKYWYSTPSSSYGSYASDIYFNSDIYTDGFSGRSDGFSVRLVRLAE